MFRKNTQHQQQPLFSTLDDLPDKQRHRLETSWAAIFYADFFCRIDEDIFSILYSDQASRPNIAVNVLVSLEVLKSGFGWSDAELDEQMTFNIQTRYALGYRDLTVGHFELRTVYNFRQRLAQHMQETGENLLEEVFEQITDKQIEVLKLKTSKMRMDSTQIASNIRQMSRMQLLVEVIQRVWRILNETQQAHYETEFAPYRQGSSGQYVYHIKSGAGQSHLEKIGYLMRRLVTELAANYGEEAVYQMLARVYGEHFVEVETGLRPKAGEELSAQSLQAPDDWEAAYREKNGKGYQGYVTNITETCDPQNDLQLIVKVQTEPNSADDAAMLAEAVPNLVERSAVDEMYTDGAYGSPDVDVALNAEQIALYQSAIRGRKTDASRLGLADFEFRLNPEGQPEQVKCPQGQQVAVKAGRKIGRFSARFDALACARCPLIEPCPTQPLKRNRGRTLRFKQQEVNLARRRRNHKQAKASGCNLRSAVEATVRSLKHPFGNGKLPVRGKRRVSMMMVASAAMTNVRRIWHHRRAESTKIMGKCAPKQAISFCFRAFLRPIFRFQTTQAQCRPVAA